VEAASRSLTDHSEEAIKALVNRLLDQQVADGRHDESPLSFLDIGMIKDTFIMRLRSMYHGRVSYPPEAQKIG
jgi:membrane-associated HD superfamily phosphohydrolase